MPKNSIKQIQKDEKKIIDELLINAHNSINEIANKLGFSRQKVWRVIKNLEKEKTIWGYTAIIDDNKIGQKRYFILLKKAPVKITDDALNTVIKRDLRNIATKNGVNLESTYFFHGEYDGQICVTAQNTNQVKNFINAMLMKIGPAYFKETKILEVLVPIQVRGFNNPNVKELKEFFSIH